MSVKWLEQIGAPAAIVAIHQTGSAIDLSRAVPPVKEYKKVETYTAYVPAGILLGWNLFARRVPPFVEDMLSPAMTVALDKLGAKLVTWVTTKAAGAGSSVSSAVRQAEAIIAQQRAAAQAAHRQIAQAGMPVSGIGIHIQEAEILA